MKKIIALFLAALMALSLCACGGSSLDPKYASLIESLDNHDYEAAMGQVMALRQQAIENGDIVVLEPQEEDYDLVSRYRRAANFLMNYSPNGYYSIYDEENDRSLSGNDALAFCYAELQALTDVDQWLNSEYFSFEDGFPTDRQELLNNFKIIENVKQKITRSTVDNMGNASTNDYVNYYYDEAGNLTMENIEWYASRLVWEGIYSTSGYYRYTFNDAGQITQTQVTNVDGTTVNAVISHTYDSNGNRISDSITDNNGEYIFTYTYDANNRLIQMDHDGDYNDYSVFYTYDDAGVLTQKDVCTYYYINEDTRFTNKQQTTVYTVENGRHTSAVVTTQSFSWNYDRGNYTPYVYSEKIDTISYVYDDQGRLIQENWQYGSTLDVDGDTQAPEYANQTLDILYGEFYIYNP